jgi:dTDP-4-amino-4,6-dideoxygalactose transaminase
MNDIAAAIGRAQLARFSQISEKRRRNARMYVEAFSTINNIQLFPLNIETAVPHIFPIIVKNGKRDELQAFMQEAGIETGIQYKPNHMLSYFNLGYDLPNAARLYKNILSLPIHPLLSEADIKHVINTMFIFFNK